jgi:tetratricopeptide (TPR) repeat protein
MRDLADRILPRLDARELGCAYDFMTRGNCRCEVGRIEEGLADYDEAVRLEPGHEGGMCWYNRGNVLYDLGRYEEAAASHLEATKYPIGRSQSVTWGNAAACYVKLGRHDDALRVLDDYLATKPDPKNWGESPGFAWKQKGWVLREAGRLDDAREAYLQATRVEPRDPMYQYVAGDFLLLFGNDSRAAIACYEAFRELTPDDGLERASALTRLAVAHWALGETERARALWADAEALDPELGSWAPRWAGTSIAAPWVRELLGSSATPG